MTETDLGTSERFVPGAALVVLLFHLPLSPSLSGGGRKVEAFQIQVAQVQVATRDSRSWKIRTCVSQSCGGLCLLLPSLAGVCADDLLMIGLPMAPGQRVTPGAPAESPGLGERAMQARNAS